MPFGDIYKIRVLAALGTQTSLNVLHYVTTAEPGQAARPIVIAGVVGALLAPKYKAVMQNNASFRGTDCQKIWPPPVGLASNDITNIGVGTAGPLALSAATAGLISLKTDFSGRRQQGRVYVPFPSGTDDQQPGQPLGTYVTRLQALADQLKLPITVTDGGNSTTLQLCIYSRDTHVASQVTKATASIYWATQRRRGIKAKGDVVPF